MSDVSADILKGLLNGDKTHYGNQLYAILEGITPPELCRVSLTMLAANYAEIKDVKKRVEELANSPRAWWNRVVQGVITGVGVAVALAVAKAMGWM